MLGLDSLSKAILLALIGCTIFVWFEIFAGKPSNVPRVYFLDVGQGDAELAIFPGNVKVLTDAGPDKKILAGLGDAIGSDRYIDIGVISHPQLDHFNGFNYLLDNYRFGAFIFNGRADSPAMGEWQTLMDKIKSRNIPLLTLGAGDKINYLDNEVDFISPNKDFIQSAELNDTVLVELVKMPAFKALFTSDAGFNIEDYLIKNNVNIAADILKVGHHGSKYSSSEEFLKAVNPKMAVVEVGAKNTYGHPAEEALSRIASIAAKIFRTDQNGTIEVLADNQKLKVYAEK
jgi:beta-lactamase superfamily II metal-dependent hydrolase